VHDLSSLTEPQARALLRSAPGICVSYLVRSDGEIRFRPEPVAAQLAPLVPIDRLRRNNAGMAVAAAALGTALAACAPHGNGSPDVRAIGEITVVDHPGSNPVVPDPAEPTHERIVGGLQAPEPEIRVKGDVAPSEPEVRRLGEPVPDPVPTSPPTRRMGKPIAPHGP
jgi:hypothetical protein